MRTSFFVGWLFLTGVASSAGCGSSVMEGTGGTSTSGTSTSTSSTSATSSSTSTGGTGGAGGGLAPGQCRTMSDCPAFDECLQPGGFQGCGVCDPGMMVCNSDADCAAEGATAICTTVPCACSGAQTCTQGCSPDAPCGAGETCGPTHRCAPTACASTSDCPTDFTCSGAMCQRVSCTGDAMCSGYCVGGLCYETPGTCTTIPA